MSAESLAPNHEWAKEIVEQWARETTDVALLRAWFDASRKRLAELGATRRGIPLVVGADVYANGTVYVIERVEEYVEMVDITSHGDTFRTHTIAAVRVRVDMRKTGP